MNTRKFMKRMLLVFGILLVLLTVFLIYEMQTYGNRWLSSPYNQRLIQQKKEVTAGSILDRNGEALAWTDKHGKRTYHSNKTTRLATSHVVGDDYGQTYGAETLYSKYLLGLEQGFLSKTNAVLSGQKPRGSDVYLTVDAKLCAALYDALGSYRGAAVILNYRTGEVLASVSKPAFDPKKMEQFLSGDVKWDGSALVNRVTMGRYTPGSTFKIVTALGALRYISGIQTRTFTCEGPLAFDAESGRYQANVQITPEMDQEAKQALEAGEESILSDYNVLRDYNGDYHGAIDMKTAFAKSCNHAFAQLALEIGTARLAQTAKSLGVGEDFLFEDLIAYASQYEAGNTDHQLAWSGVGQYKDLMTPLHMCLISAAIANDGVMMEPRMLQMVADNGTVTRSLSPKSYRAVMTAQEAQVLREYMVACVEEGTGKSAAVSGVTVGGKTGTAEVSSLEEDRPNAWFTGFVADEEHPLAICVVLEKGGSGGSKAAPIAAKAIRKAIALGY